MQRPSDETYRVEFVVGVWKQLELLSEEQQNQLELDLQEVARKATEAPRAGAPGAPQTAVLGSLRVRYEVTPGRRMLTVLDVTRIEER